MKNPATPLPANETRGVGMLSIISQLLFHIMLLFGHETNTLPFPGSRSTVAVCSYSYSHMSSIKLLWSILSVESDKSGSSCRPDSGCTLELYRGKDVYAIDYSTFLVKPGEYNGPDMSDGQSSVLEELGSSDAPVKDIEP